MHPRARCPTNSLFLPAPFSHLLPSNHRLLLCLRLFVVSRSSLSSLGRSDPPCFSSKVICAMDANVLYDLKECLSYDWSSYCKQSPSLFRLTASRRPVRLSTRLAFLSITIPTTTTVGIQLVTNSFLDNSFD